MTVHGLLSRLDGVAGREPQWKARCPAHEDKRLSLSVGVSRLTGATLVHCHAGCKTEEVASALGLSMADMLAGGGRGSDARPTVVAKYDYKDGGGRLVYQVVRLRPKSFRQRKPSPRGGWDWTSVRQEERLLYRLPQLIERTGVVYFVEGEKDVENLIGLGAVATTVSGGAGRPPGRQTLMPLAGRDVCVIPDADEPGMKWASAVVDRLHGIARRACILDLMLSPKQDVSDWLAKGGKIDMLSDLASLELDASDPVFAARSYARALRSMATECMRASTAELERLSGQTLELRTR